MLLVSFSAKPRRLVYIAVTKMKVAIKVNQHISAKFYFIQF